MPVMTLPSTCPSSLLSFTPILFFCLQVIPVSTDQSFFLIVHFALPYVQPYASMYVHSYVSVYVQPYVSMYVHPYASMYVHPCTSMYVHLYVSMYVQPYVSMYVHPYASMYVHSYVSMYVHPLRLYDYLFIPTSLCECLCRYVHTSANTLIAVQV